MIDKNTELQKFINKLHPIFARAAVGDFSKDVNISETETEFTQFEIGVQLMLEVIREKIEEYKKLNLELENKVGERTKELQSSQASFLQIINAAPDAFIIVDQEGKISRANQQAETIFGYTARELTGLPVDMLLPGRFRDIHAHHRADYFNKPRTRPMGAGLELFALHKNGKEFPVEISLSPLTEPGNVSAMAIIRDISARKKIEQELQERAEELEKLNAIMVGRELRMVELKERIAELESKAHE